MLLIKLILHTLKTVNINYKREIQFIDVILTSIRENYNLNINVRFSVNIYYHSR